MIATQQCIYIHFSIALPFIDSPLLFRDNIPLPS